MNQFVPGSFLLLFVGGIGALTLGSHASATAAPSAEAVEFFEKKVRPVLADNCYVCHGPQLQQSGLRLDSKEGIEKGGNRGPAINVASPGESLLLNAVRHQGLQMPPAGKLSGEQIAALERWVEMGAPWPEAGAEKPLSADDPEFYQKMAREHWAFQRVRRPVLPEVLQRQWPGNAVDRFLLASLEKGGLTPAEQADKATLIRRLSYVLTGLPPSRQEVEQFLRDTSPDSYQHLADRLLASPHFGEHWARHWMDGVRFGETFGNDWNYELHGAHHYRDYLIRAFNQDVPYNQLVREHIAGDLLDQPRVNEAAGINESLIGPAFFRLGEQGHDDCTVFREVRTDVVDNQIDTLGKAFQGLTISCARCHDHKLDPIPTKDYYALYGILTSSRLVTRTIDSSEMNRSSEQNLKGLKEPIRREVAALWLGEIGDLRDYLLGAQTAYDNSGMAQIPDAPVAQHRIDRLLCAFDTQKPALEDPLAPWIMVVREASSAPGGIREAWRNLATRYARQQRMRADFNKSYFVPFGDAETSFAGWHPDGLGLHQGLSPSGEFAVKSEGDNALMGVYPRGIYTHKLSAKLNGALRSPFLPKDWGFVSLRVVGDELASWRSILDNCMLSDQYGSIGRESPEWITISTRNEHKQYPLYVELVTKSDNPRLPDRPTQMTGISEKELESPYSHFGITDAVLHDCPEPPQEEVTHVARLFEGDEPEDLAGVADRYVAVARQAIEAWAEGNADNDDAQWVNWLLQNGLVLNSKESSARLSELISAYRASEEQVSQPRVVHGMADVDAGYNFPLLPRGDAQHPGDPVPRGYLGLLTDWRGSFEVNGSGRRQLADVIASADNPLTARVMVNRLWQHVFGRGIVETANDFGRFGAKPSHRELLDYLAVKFVDHGWSIKKLLRELVLSKTFQQSSDYREAANVIDPDNELVHRYPVRRLTAESVRDAILATSGRLDAEFYGPSIHPYRTEPKDYRKLYSGPLDGEGRRSLYLKVTRHEGSRFLETFDFPSPAVARGKRDVTNVPSQALTLLNDPFVIDQAQFWANRLVAQPTPSVESRLNEMFLMAMGRRPNNEDQRRLRGLVDELASLQEVDTGDVLANRDLWKDVAHVMFNMKEFIYIR